MENTISINTRNEKSPILSVDCVDEFSVEEALFSRGRVGEIKRVEVIVGPRGVQCFDGYGIKLRG